MRVLLATDASWLVDAIVAALDDGDTSFTVCSDGREVSKQLAKGAKAGDPPFDIAIVDLQIGSMGGMAVAMAIRLDASAGTAPDVPVLLLLDRVADVHLAKRGGADGWIIKPLDPIRFRRAVTAVVAGRTYTEGLPPFTATVAPEADDVTRDAVIGGDAPPESEATLAESARTEPAPAG